MHKFTVDSRRVVDPTCITPVIHLHRLQAAPLLEPERPAAEAAAPYGPAAFSD